ILKLGKCNESEFCDLFQESNYFSQFINIKFAEQMQYPKKVCPFAFKKVKLGSLSFEYDVFQFDSRNFTNLNTLHSNIGALLFWFTVNLNVNRNLIHPQVFENLRTLYISGSLRKIETDLFKSYK